MFEGGCLCGAIRYRIDAEPVVVAHCHCSNCQKLSGAGHSTGAMFLEAAVTVSGTPAEYRMTADSGSTVTRRFCPTCGSTLFGRNTGMPGFVTVAAGTLDDPGGVTPTVTVFARNRPHWDFMDGSLPTFGDQPGWKPGDEPGAGVRPSSGNRSPGS